MTPNRKLLKIDGDRKGAGFVLHRSLRATKKFAPTNPEPLISMEPIAN